MNPEKPTLLALVAATCALVERAADEADPHTGEIPTDLADEIDALLDAQGRKIDAYGAVDTALKAEAARISAEVRAYEEALIAPLKKRIRAAERAQERLRDRLFIAAQEAGGVLEGEAWKAKIQRGAPALVDKGVGFPGHMALDAVNAALDAANSDMDAREKLIALIGRRELLKAAKEAEIEGFSVRHVEYVRLTPGGKK